MGLPVWDLVTRGVVRQGPAGVAKGRQGSVAHEIQKIIEGPYTLLPKWYVIDTPPLYCISDTVSDNLIYSIGYFVWS